MTPVVHSGTFSRKVNLYGGVLAITNFLEHVGRVRVNTRPYCLGRRTGPRRRRWGPGRGLGNWDRWEVGRSDPSYGGELRNGKESND